MLRYLPHLALALLCAAGAQAETGAERLEQLVPTLPRNSNGLPMYWLEMETLVGWERMMLVFGYAENGTPCGRLRELASEDAPDRQFRCTMAN